VQVQRAASSIVRHAIGLLALMIALSACGTKGPLYLPEQKAPQNNKQQEPRP
jgi:predicted small lipoprotein YifL